MSDTGRDAFSQLLYPMLSEQPRAGEGLLRTLAEAPTEKAAESDRLRDRLLADAEDEILGCAVAIATRLGRGGRVLAAGNGGSATTAADLAGELLHPGASADGATARPLPALCLTTDVAVVTAVANDVSFDDVFLRQVVALGRPEDVLVAVSTSGSSENLVRALREARRRGMLTVGLGGHDGGRMARDGILDHSFVVPSSSVHRIQEVQTALSHLLVQLVQSITETAACV